MIAKQWRISLITCIFLVTNALFSANISLIKNTAAVATFPDGNLFNATPFIGDNSGVIFYETFNGVNYAISHSQYDFGSSTFNPITTDISPLGDPPQINFFMNNDGLGVMSYTQGSGYNLYTYDANTDALTAFPSIITVNGIYILKSKVKDSLTDMNNIGKALCVSFDSPTYFLKVSNIDNSDPANPALTDIEDFSTTSTTMDAMIGVNNNNRGLIVTLESGPSGLDILLVNDDNTVISSQAGNDTNAANLIDVIYSDDNIGTIIYGAKNGDTGEVKYFTLDASNTLSGPHMLYDNAALMINNPNQPAAGAGFTNTSPTSPQQGVVAVTDKSTFISKYTVFNSTTNTFSPFSNLLLAGPLVGPTPAANKNSLAVFTYPTQSDTFNLTGADTTSSSVSPPIELGSFGSDDLFFMSTVLNSENVGGAFWGVSDSTSETYYFTPFSILASPVHKNMLNNMLKYPGVRTLPGT